MCAVFMLILALQTAVNAPSHPKKPIDKNISTDIKKNNSSGNGRNLPSPTPVTKDSTNRQQRPEPKSSDNEDYPAGITNRVESAPQPEGWFKTYVVATLVIAVAGLITMFVVLRQLYLMKLEQRAWVFISTPSCRGLAPDSRELVIRIGIGNTGLTPAKRVTRSLIVKLIEQGCKPDFDFPDPVGANAVVFPTQEVFAYSSLELDGMSGDFRRIFERKVVVWVYGKITYKNVFGQRHWTKFCFTLDNPSKNIFKAHTEHNETDD